LAAFHNSPLDSSKKSVNNSPLPVESAEPRRKRFVLSESMQQAISLAKRFGIPLSHRNLYVIDLAVQAESEFRQISLCAAAANIREGALAEIARGGSLNYFFFEDAGWRPSRREETNRMEAAVGMRPEESAAKPPKCSKCLDTGLWARDQRGPCPECGACWRCESKRRIWNNGPGPRLIECPDCSEVRV
jgi:hypothetical protein